MSYFKVILFSRNLSLIKSDNIREEEFGKIAGDLINKNMMKAFNDVVPFYSVNTFALSQVCRYLSTSYAGDLGLAPGLGRSPRGGNGNPLQCSCLENPLEQRSLACCTPWSRKDLATDFETKHSIAQQAYPRLFKNYTLACNHSCIVLCL